LSSLYLIIPLLIELIKLIKFIQSTLQNQLNQLFNYTTFDK